MAQMRRLRLVVANDLRSYRKSKSGRWLVAAVLLAVAVKRVVRLHIARWRRCLRPVIRVDLHRISPVSRACGLDRGQAIDRYYIEAFLAHHANDICGQVLEIADNEYTRRFGGARVERSDVLHIEPCPFATIVADLTDAPEIISHRFDCIILTQTLPFIYDARAAVHTVHRILKPGGTVLVTVPGISQISRHDMDRWGDYWRFTSLSARLMFEEVFLPQDVTVETYGNVLVATAFLYGLAAEELKQEELEHWDPDYEVVISVRAVKQANL